MLTKAQRKLIKYFKNNVIPNPDDPNYEKYKSVRDLNPKTVHGES